MNYDDGWIYRKNWLRSNTWRIWKAQWIVHGNRHHKRLIAWQKKATENIIKREKELYKELADVRKELNVLRYDRRIDFYDGWAKRFNDLEEKERDIIRHIRLLDRN